MNAVSGGEDMTFRIWDLAAGKSLRTYQMKSQVRAVCYRNDGLEILSACEDGSIHFWNPETDTCRSFNYGPNRINRACYGPNNDSFFLNDYRRVIWGRNGEVIHNFYEHSREVWGICLHPSENSLFTGSADGSIRMWDLQSRNCLRIYSVYQSKPFSIALTPDGKKLISGNEDNTIKVWNTETGKCIRTYEGHTDFVTAVSISPDGKRIISGSSDGSMKIWTTPEEGDIEWIVSSVHTTELSADNARIFKQLSLKINTLIADGHISEALITFEELKKVRQFGDGDIFYGIYRKLTNYCSFSNSIILQEMHEMEIELDSVTAFSRDGRTALSGRMWQAQQMFIIESFENRRNPGNVVLMNLWDFPSGKCLRQIRGSLEHSILSLRLSSDAGKAISGGMDNAIKIWDMTNGECINTLIGHSQPVGRVRFNHDDTLILSGSIDRTIKLWNSHTGKCIQTFTGHSGVVIAVTFSPDETKILSGSQDCTLKLWDVHTGKCIHTFTGHTNHIITALFTPNGKIAVSGGKDDSIILWDITSGAAIRTIRNAGAVSRLLISGDGSKLLSGEVSYETKTVKMWDLETGECIHTFEGLSEYFSPVYFGADNKIIIISKKIAFVYQMVFGLHFPGWKDWDEGARPYLDIFLALHPNWNDEDFNNILIPELQIRGYGWLRPEGVRAKLNEISKPPKIPPTKKRTPVQTSNPRINGITFKGNIVVAAIKYFFFSLAIPATLLALMEFQWNLISEPSSSKVVAMLPFGIQWITSFMCLYGIVSLVRLRFEAFAEFLYFIFGVSLYALILMQIPPEEFVLLLRVSQALIILSFLLYSLSRLDKLPVYGDSYTIKTVMLRIEGSPSIMFFKFLMRSLIVPFIVCSIFIVFDLSVTAFWKTVFSIYGFMWAWYVIRTFFLCAMLSRFQPSRSYSIYNYLYYQAAWLLLPSLGLFLLWYFEWFPMKTWLIWVYGIYGFIWLIISISSLKIITAFKK